MLQTYRDVCKAAGEAKEFANFLLKDLRLCSEEETRVLNWIIPGRDRERSVKHIYFR